MINMAIQSTEYLHQQRKGRLILICLLIFFITPIIAVIAMYKLDWRPKGESVGELVTPPKTIAINPALTHSNDTKVSLSQLKDKWSMIYVTAECDMQCKNKLHQMRQLHVSLYKEIPRMQRVLITTSQDVADLTNNYPELIIINQPSEAVLAFSQQFNIGSESAINSHRIYLSDPLGQLIMSYQTSTSAALVRKDITRLMKYSWTG